MVQRRMMDCKTARAKFGKCIGSRAEVWHGNAYKTSGGLTKKDLFYNTKTGRIVSRAKRAIGKRIYRENGLAQHQKDDLWTYPRKKTRKKKRKRASRGRK